MRRRAGRTQRGDPGAEDAQQGEPSTVMITLIPALEASSTRRSAKACVAGSICPGLPRLKREPLHLGADDLGAERARGGDRAVGFGERRARAHADDVDAAEQRAFSMAAAREAPPRRRARVSSRRPHQRARPRSRSTSGVLILNTIVARSRRLAEPRRSAAAIGHGVTLSAMSPTWIWMQIAIVVFVAIRMVIAITRARVAPAPGVRRRARWRAVTYRRGAGAAPSQLLPRRVTQLGPSRLLRYLRAAQELLRGRPGVSHSRARRGRRARARPRCRGGVARGRVRRM